LPLINIALIFSYKSPQQSITFDQTINPSSIIIIYDVLGLSPNWEFILYVLSISTVYTILEPVVNLIIELYKFESIVNWKLVINCVYS
jgi:hypothetical protein